MDTNCSYIGLSHPNDNSSLDKHLPLPETSQQDRNGMAQNPSSFIRSLGVFQEEFRKPLDRVLFSPYPTQNRQMFLGSPMIDNLLPRRDVFGDLLSLPRIHLQQTPLKTHVRVSKPKHSESDDPLNFSDYQYEQQDIAQYQTPTRNGKIEQYVEPATAYTAKVSASLQKMDREEVQPMEVYRQLPPKLNNIKGLRALAQDVSIIVNERKFTTYKQVAQLQIQKMQREGKISRNSKDSQNVKRRVYDALNVLISAGVLVRDGKIVSVDPTSSNSTSKNVGSEERTKLQEHITNLRTSLSQKEAKLRSLQMKYLAHQYLINRNKSQLDSNTKKLSLPCLAIIGKIGNHKCRLLRRTLRICTKNPAESKVIADLDVLVELGFHNLNNFTELPHHF